MPRGFLASEQHPTSKLWVVLEDNGVVAWLYLTEGDSYRIIADCWVYNRGAAVEEAEVEKYRGSPPPAPHTFAAPEATMRRAKKGDVSFRWSRNGKAAAVALSGHVTAFVAVTFKRGWAVGLKRTGPWGGKWSPRRYSRTFGDSVKPRQ
jgi:hypothetical protein